MAKIKVAKHFRIVNDMFNATDYPPGEHEIDDKLMESHGWFIKHHLEPVTEPETVTTDKDIEKAKAEAEAAAKAKAEADEADAKKKGK